MAAFKDMGPRDDGSSGEAAAFAYIAGVLQNLGIPYELTNQNTVEGGHSFSSNLSAVIPGNRDGRIILAAPIDNGAFGAAFLLDMADRYRKNPPAHEIVLMFLGAERGDSAYHPYGSRTAARQIVNSELNLGTALLYLDSDDVPSQWRIRPGGNGIVTPRWLTSAISEAITEHYAQFQFRGTDIQLARLGLQGEISLLTPWLEADVPSVLLAGRGESNGADRYLKIERLAKVITSFDTRLGKIPDNTQSSYIYVRPMSDANPIVVPELPYVVVFLSLSAVLMIAILARYRTVTLNLRRFSPRLWAWPLLTVLVFLYFFLATLLVEEALFLADFPTLWKSDPGIFIFFKLSIAAALSLDFILLTRGLPLPRSPHFYSYLAVVTASLASTVLIALDITLGGYSLITITAMLIFTAIKNIRWKVFILFLSFIPYLIALLVIVNEPYQVIIESLLFGRIGGNIILTLILMPPILGIISLSYWRLHYHRTRSGILAQLTTFILNISAVLTLVWILNINPYSSSILQPVTLIDRIDMNSQARVLEISSPAAIDAAVLSLEGSEYPLEGLGRRAEVRTPLNRQPLEISYTGHTFLGRRTISALISGEDAPDNLAISLHSRIAFTLHDSEYPSQRSTNGKSAVIFVGKHPPFPLSLELTVNNDAEIVMECVATWQNPIDPPEVDRSDLESYAHRVASLRVPIN